MNILKTKSVKIWKVAAIAATLLVTSCNRDNDEVELPVPVISKMEIGVRNSKIAYNGSDLHLGAEIDAAAKIKTVKVEIDRDNGSEVVVNKTYDGFAGLLNTHFHEHVDIPAAAKPGSYHFRFSVTDMQGKTTVLADNIEIQKNSDTQAPTITVSQSPASSQVFNNGESITVSGTVKDNVGVGGYLVALVRADDTKVSETSVIIMDLKYLQDVAEANFNSKINVGATYDNQSTPVAIKGENAWMSGDYYILVRSWDVSGNVTNTEKFPLKIKL